MAEKAEIVLSAVDRTKAAFDAAKARMAGLASEARALQSTFGGVALVSAAAFGVAFVRNAANALDALNDVSDATGSTVESISALEDVARRTGTTLESVEGILVKFNAGLNAADGKNEVSRALQAIGLEAEQLKRLDPAEALRQTAVALSQYADNGDKARLVQILFGKSVREAAPFLKDLSEQTKLVATTNTEAAQEAEKFNKQIFALEKSLADLARTAAGPVISSINATIEKFKAGAQEGKSFYRVIFEEQMKFLGLAVEPKNTAAYQAELAKVNKLLDEGYLTAEARFELEKEQAELQATIATRLAAISGTGRRPANEGGGIYKPSVVVKEEDKPPKATKETNDAEALLKKLRDQYQATLDLTTLEETLIEIRSKGFRGLTPELEKQILQQATLIDQDKKLAEERKRLNEQLDEAAETTRQFSEENIRLFQETRTPLEALNIELGRLNVQLNNGLDWDTYVRAVARAQDQFTKSTESGKKDLDEMGEFAKEAARNIQNSLGDGLLQVMEGNFKGIGDAFERTLNRMIADAVAADLAKRLMGDFDKTGKIGGLAGKGLDALAGLFKPSGGTTGDFARMDRGQGGGAAGGGAGFLGTLASLATTFAGFFAEGGKVPAGKWGWAGEEGPEPIFGGSTGLTVQPYGAGAQTVQSKSYSISVQMPQGATRETGAQFGAEMMRQLRIADARNG